jgi:anti-sigma factor RsiW
MQEQYERIEAYLDGTLPEPERKAFEAELERDKTLAAEVELHRRVHRTLGNADEWAFRQNLEAISEAYEAPAENGKPGNRSALRLLLGILILIIVASLLY